ncbi:MAG: glycosyltransferase family 2 protein [Pseudomonadota bacterium]
MNRKYHPISAVILAHQYSELFERVVQSVTWCDEIIIVMSEQAKEIEDLCQRISAKCHFRKFDGYGTQKQFAISLASHDWILNIDSDEWVSPECQLEIRRVLDLESSQLVGGFTIFRQLVFLNKPMRFSGTISRPLRLFNRTKAKMNSNLVHEEIETAERVNHLKKPVHHYSYLSLSDYFFKFNKYTSLAAEELFKKGKRTNPFLIWGRFPFLFIRRYVFQLGFLDGQHGFTWCVLSAWYSVIKYLKLHELWKKTGGEERNGA